MKRFFFFLLLLPLFSPTLFAQNAPIQGFIEQHKNESGFIHAFLSKDLFEMATQTELKNEDWNGLHNVVKNIGSLSILAADSIQNAPQLYKEAKALIPSESFDELLAVRDGSDNVRIWVKSEENVVTDLVLLVGAREEFVLVCFSGKLELGNLSELAQLFEAGKVEQLARTSERLSIEFGMSPNPSRDQFTLSYSDEQDPPSQLSMLDQNGRQILSIRLSETPTQTVVLPDIAAGVYWVQVKTRGGKIGMKQMQIVR